MYILLNIHDRNGSMELYDDDDDIEFISTKIGSCRPLRSCGYIYLYYLDNY